MPFTKAQRLKGLKKQLANLGYSVEATGAAETGPDNEVENMDDEEGKQLLDNWNAKNEAW